MNAPVSWWISNMICRKYIQQSFCHIRNGASTVKLLRKLLRRGHLRHHHHLWKWEFQIERIETPNPICSLRHLQRLEIGFHDEESDSESVPASESCAVDAVVESPAPMHTKRAGEAMHPGEASLPAKKRKKEEKEESESESESPPPDSSISSSSNSLPASNSISESGLTTGTYKKYCRCLGRCPPAYDSGKVVPDAKATEMNAAVALYQSKLTRVNKGKNQRAFMSRTSP